MTFKFAKKIGSNDSEGRNNEIQLYRPKQYQVDFQLKQNIAADSGTPCLCCQPLSRNTSAG